MNVESQLFEAMLINNMNWIVRFHNHLNSALNTARKEIEYGDTLDDVQRDFWRHVYKHNFPAQLKNASFLFMMAHLEEMLHLMWVRNEPKINLDKGHGVTRYKTFLKTHLHQ